jgi:hypothetical protein
LKLLAEVQNFDQDVREGSDCREFADLRAGLVALPVRRTDCVERRDQEYCGSCDGEAYKSQDNEDATATTT